MPSSLSKNKSRFHGTMYRNDMEQRPICKHCHKPMKIAGVSKPRMSIGIRENYLETTVYYHCDDFGCPGHKESYTRAPSNRTGLGFEYDFEVMAKVCELRWNEGLTHAEIVDRMKKDHDIMIDDSTIGNILKTYEIGCTAKYKQSIVDDIKDFGGIIMTIDAMEPLKGERPVYRARDYRTNLTLGARLMPNQKQETIEEFLQNVKQRVEKELGVPIIGIVSDALVVQRLAIEAVFPGVPHCLCHYHFYEIVLKDAKAADSNLLTSIRSMLRSLTDVKKYKAEAKQNVYQDTPKGFIDKILDALHALSSWSRKPRDPCFTGLEMHDRVLDILSVMDDAIKQMGAGIFTVDDEERLVRIRDRVMTCIDEYQATVGELRQIKVHLEGLKAILDDETTSKEEAVATIKHYKAVLDDHLATVECGELEQRFIKAFGKYVNTKAEQLFNFKIVPGAPKTNNEHELCHKQLKHMLRRIIGAKAASAYLLAHGDRITFVNPKESYEDIVKILSTMNMTEASRIIKQERRSREMLTLVMHDQQRWVKMVSNLREMLHRLKEKISISA